MILLLLVASALAAPERTEDGELVSEEITVYGEREIEQARREVIEQFGDFGYTEAVDKGDYLVLRSARAWKGEVRIYDDGWIFIKREPPRVSAPAAGKAEANSAGAWAACALHPLQCLRVGGALVSQRKFRAQEARVLAWAESDVQRYGEAVADGQIDMRVNELPDRLERLWYDGVPLDGDGVLSDVDARKQAILDFWESRTDTVWGDRVRDAVEAFIRGEVQHSDAPFTDGEIRKFNARRRCHRELDLSRDAGEVSMDAAPPVVVPTAEGQ